MLLVRLFLLNYGYTYQLYVYVFVHTVNHVNILFTKVIVLIHCWLFNVQW